jgi:hypothetical protein
MNATLPMKKPRAAIAMVQVVNRSGREQIVYPSDDERDRVEYIIDEIVRRLRQHRHPERSEPSVRDGVVTACSTMLCAGASLPSRRRREWPGSLRPDTVKKRITNIRELAGNLYDALLDISPGEEMLAFEEYGVFEELGSIVTKVSKHESGRAKKPQWEEVFKHNKRDFLNRLRRLQTLPYRDPPLNDQVQQLSAEIAYKMMCRYSNAKPTGTKDGLFQEITKHLYEVARPSPDGKVFDPKRPCDRVLKRHRPSPRKS